MENSQALGLAETPTKDKAANPTEPIPAALVGGDFRHDPVTEKTRDRVRQDSGSWVARSWWTVAGLIVILWALRLSGYVTLFPLVSLAVVAVAAWGLGTIVTSWSSPRVSARTVNVLSWATLGVVIGAYLLWAYLQVYSSPAYGTDEIAFDQYAAQLLVHGINPYAHSMAPAFALFHLSPNNYTFQLTGAPVTTLSYPALAFELYAVLIWLGWTTQVAVALDVIAWAAGIAMLFAVLPRRLRPLALVVGSISVYVAYAVGGVTDSLYVPLLVIAAVRWDRFGVLRGRRAWWGPILFGLAMSVKQTPWLILPFVTVALVLEAKGYGGWRVGLRTGVRYVAIALSAFLTSNLVFMILAPKSWLIGVLNPFISHNVPAGQGLIGLSLFLGVGGGSLAAYSAAVAVGLGALIIIYGVTYPTLKAWTFVLPALVLFFSSRSFGSYLVMLIPAGLVGAVTVRRASVALASRRQRMWVVGALAATAIPAGVALSSSSPLRMSIESVETTGELATVDRVVVRVTNTTGRTVRPAFSMESGTTLTAFWSATGPAVLRPGERATFNLSAPNFFAQPSITGGFQVVAFTQAPGTVSRSPAYLPTTSHVVLEPDAVDRSLTVGHPFRITAEVLDQLDRPVEHANVAVYLGQVIYAEVGLEFGDAIINSSPPGETPVVAYTDASGVATFTVTGTVATADPVYFEANLVNTASSYPYGYSDIVPIRFVGP